MPWARCNVILALALACAFGASIAAAEESPPADAAPAEAADEVAVDVDLQLTGPARAAKPKAIDEVVVTAQKRAQDVQDVPISITALTDDFLKDSGSTGLLEIGRFTPNVSLNQMTDSRSTVIRIRGIGSEGSNAGIDPAVGVFVDGIYQGRTGLASSLDLADVERIEVLRGPQGTLWGKNTAAGAISVVTKRPQLNEWGAFFENSWGSYDDRQVRGTVNVPVIDDRLAMRLTGYFSKRDGFDTNRFDGGNRNDVDRNGARLKTLFNLSDSLELLVWADYATEQTTCCVADISSYSGPPSLFVRFRDLAAGTGRPLPPVDVYDRLVDANEPSTNDTRLVGVSAELNWTVRDHVLTLLTGYRNFKSFSVLDGDFSSYDAVTQTTDEQFQQWSSELRLASPGGERFDWVGGLYFYYQEDETLGKLGIGPDWIDNSPIGPFIGSGDVDADGDVSGFDTNTHETWSYAAFGQGTYSLLDSLALTVGLRLNYERKARVGTQIAGFKGVDQGPFGPDLYADESFSVFNVSPMGALRWFPTSESMLFLSVARGFKSGGFTQLRTVGGRGTNFDDEEATDLEAGFRTTWFDRMITLNATAFHTWYDNFQAVAFDGTGISVTNAGKLRSWGVEADGLVVPHPYLQLGFGLGYNPTVYDEFPLSPCTAKQIAKVPLGTTCVQDLAGRPKDNAPEWSASVFANFERPVGRLPHFDLPLLGFVRGDWSFQSKIFLQQDLDPNLIQPGYGLLNLRTGLRTEDEHWEVTFGVQNVTDQDFRVVAFDVPILNGYAAIVGPRRTFVGTIRYRY